MLDWQEEALCKNRGNIFYSVQKGQASNYDKEAAIRLCSSCPVREQCLEYALSNGEEYGIWGGREFSVRSTERVNRHRASKSSHKLQDI